MINYKTMSLRQLANAYNDMAEKLGKSTINKFSNRESGVRRTKALAAEINAIKKRGRPATYAGTKLYPLVDGNPRRRGSHGWHSFKIILNNPGITYDDFIKKGGLNHGLRWDVGHGYVEARS